MDFPDKTGGLPNSPGPVPPKVKKEPVITGAKQVKRPVSRRFLQFLNSENPRHLGAQVGREVFLPQLKMALEGALNAFISNMFWGNTANRPMSNMVRQATLRSNVPYNILSSGATSLLAQVPGNQMVVHQKSSGNYEDLVVPSIQDAQILLADLLDTMEQYRLVTVGDLYEAASMPTVPSHSVYGWTSLDGARIVPGRGGFILELPRPTVL